MAALLFNMKELGITNEVLCKAAQVSQEDLHQAIQNRGKAKSKDAALSGSLRRAIPIFLSERQLRQTGGKPEDASLEVQILVLAEEYEALTSWHKEGRKCRPRKPDRK